MTAQTTAQTTALPAARGPIEANAPFARFIWFRCGGHAEHLFRPEDVEDLAQFLAALPQDVPLFPVGVGSNLIVRDGGVPGVTIRLPKSFAKVEVEGEMVRAGAGAMGITVANRAQNASLAGMEFLRGIPGTIGGAVRMNAGAYGREVADLLAEATVVTRQGQIEVWPAARFSYSYRHSALPPEYVVVEALLRGTPGDKARITAEMDRIVHEREVSQPLRSRTGGSTFKNPQGHKAWELVDAAGCRGLRIGGAQVSEKHANFLINTGDASATDIERLGAEVRRRVKAHSGITLEWEIQRVGIPAAGLAKELAEEVPA